MGFDFATASRILFGPGTVRKVAPAARAMGSRVLLATGRSPDRAAALADELGAVVFAVDGEPSVELVRRGVGFAR
jgi:alcohol dehydrogenase YqhD (iron-dependent ADH family)